MKKGFKNILFFLSTLAVFSCSSSSSDEISSIHEDNGNKMNRSYSLIGDKNELNSYLEYGNVGYSLRAVSALGFLKKQGKEIDQKDVDDLNKETVIIIEYASLTNKAVTDIDQIRLSDDDLMSYLSGEFNKSFRSIQNGELQTPSGAQLDGSLRIDSKIKILLFGLKLDLSLPFKIEYFDSIFGAGKMTFKFNENKQLV